MALSQISRDDCIAYIAEFPSMREYLDKHSQGDPFGIKSITREKAARAYMAEMMKDDGLDLFNIYEQDSEVVRLKRDQAEDAKASATLERANNGKPDYKCSLCPDEILLGGVSFFTLHNRTEHTLDPSEAIYCPHPDCDTVFRRGRDIDPDEHLAIKHHDLRNLQGHGGTLLDRVTDFRFIAADTVFKAVMREKHRLEVSLACREEYMQDLGDRVPELHTHVLPEVLQILLDDIRRVDCMANVWGDFTQENKEYVKQWTVRWIMDVREFLEELNVVLMRAEALIGEKPMDEEVTDEGRMDQGRMM